MNKDKTHGSVFTENTSLKQTRPLHLINLLSQLKYGIKENNISYNARAETYMKLNTDLLWWL